MCDKGAAELIKTVSNTTLAQEAASAASRFLHTNFPLCNYSYHLENHCLNKPESYLSIVESWCSVAA